MEELKKHKFIIIGGDGVNALGIIRCLGKEGLKSHIIRFRETRDAIIDHSRYVEAIHYVDTCEEMMQVLGAHYGTEEYKPILYFTYEGHELYYDKQPDEIKNKYIAYGSAFDGGLSTLERKSVQCRLAEDCGIDIPKGMLVAKGDLPKGISYPVITKTDSSIDGHWKGDMIVCRTEEELKEAYTRIAADRILVEEYIEGVKEVDIKGFSVNEGRDVFFTHQKTWKTKTDKTGGMMYFEPCADADLLQMIKLMIRKAKYNGIFDAEFIQDAEGQLYFLEVNWRTGMYNYNHVLEGVNLPYLWAKAMVEGEIKRDDISVKPVKYTAYDELLGFASCLRKPKQLVDWMIKMVKADMLYYGNKKDYKAGLVAWKMFCRHKFTRLVRK